MNNYKSIGESRAKEINRTYQRNLRKAIQGKPLTGQLFDDAFFLAKVLTKVEYGLRKSSFRSEIDGVEVWVTWQGRLIGYRYPRAFHGGLGIGGFDTVEVGKLYEVKAKRVRVTEIPEIW
jgi:hypothetical protein